MADKLYGLADLKAHTTDKSCWLLVHGKVYDVTDFLEEHPGGYDIILTSTGAGLLGVGLGRAHQSAEGGEGGVAG